MPKILPSTAPPAFPGLPRASLQSPRTCQPTSYELSTMQYDISCLLCIQVAFFLVQHATATLHYRKLVHLFALWSACSSLLLWL